MLSAVVAVCATVLVPAAQAQQQADIAAIAAQRDAIKKLGWMHGVWRGPAVSRTPNGDHRITQTERIGSFLDGTLVVMEGKGYNADGSVGFNALGVASYDAQTRSYWLTSWALGRSGKFPMQVTDNGYVWEVPTGAARIRYAATVTGGIWTEVGDYILSGQSPRRFFTMTLMRAGDSDWPLAGGVPSE